MLSSRYNTMKREILFRGKSIDDNQWIYGNLIRRVSESPLVETSGCYVYYYISEIDFDGKTTEVHAGTLGQYIGIKDKEGNKIFEGDIVQYDDRPYNAYASLIVGEVMRWRDRWILYEDKETFPTKFPIFSDDFFERKSIVLGNVFDNPELDKKIQ